MYWLYRLSCNICGFRTSRFWNLWVLNPREKGPLGPSELTGAVLWLSLEGFLRPAEATGSQTTCCLWPQNSHFGQKKTPIFYFPRGKPQVIILISLYDILRLGKALCGPQNALLGINQETRSHIVARSRHSKIHRGQVQLRGLCRPQKTFRS